jgi:hypothetical protein
MGKKMVKLKGPATKTSGFLHEVCGEDGKVS